jgi:flagellin-specific chaperone FliS
MNHLLTAQPFTVSAGGRTLALFHNGVRNDLVSALGALQAGDDARARSDLHRAQRTLLEMIRALDPRVSPDLSLSLSSCYQSIFDTVSEALAHPSPGSIRKALDRLERVREAWLDAHTNIGGCSR